MRTQKSFKLTAFVLPLGVPSVLFLPVLKSFYNTEPILFDYRVSRSHRVDLISDTVGCKAAILEAALHNVEGQRSEPENSQDDEGQVLIEDSDADETSLTLENWD